MEAAELSHSPERSMGLTRMVFRTELLPRAAFLVSTDLGTGGPWGGLEHQDHSFLFALNYCG